MAKISIGNQFVSTTNSLGQNRNIQTTGGRIGINIDGLSKEIQDVAKDVFKQTATAQLNLFFKRQHTNGGYGVKAKNNSLNSIKKWKVAIDTNSDFLTAGFYNTAENKDNGFTYVNTLYGKKGQTSDGDYGYHAVTKDGYGAKSQGFDKEKVEEVKSRLKESFIKAFKKKGI